MQNLSSVWILIWEFPNPLLGDNKKAVGDLSLGQTLLLASRTYFRGESYPQTARESREPSCNPNQSPSWGIGLQAWDPTQKSKRWFKMPKAKGLVMNWIKVQLAEYKAKNRWVCMTSLNRLAVRWMFWAGPSTQDWEGREKTLPAQRTKGWLFPPWPYCHNREGWDKGAQHTEADPRTCGLRPKLPSNKASERQRSYLDMLQSLMKKKQLLPAT